MSEIDFEDYQFDRYAALPSGMPKMHRVLHVAPTSGAARLAAVWLALCKAFLGVVASESHSFIDIPRHIDPKWATVCT